MSNICKEDLEYFLRFVETKRDDNELNHIDFYFLHTREELNKFIKIYLEKNNVNNKYDLIYMIKSIIKYMSGIHDFTSNITDLSEKSLPFTLKFVENELYIDKCYDNMFNKAKIIGINGENIGNLMLEMEKIIPYPTKEWLLKSLESGFCDKNMILSLPSIKNDNKMLVINTNIGNLSIDLDHNYPFLIDNVDNYKVINNVLLYDGFKNVKNNEINYNDIEFLINNNKINSLILDLRDKSDINIDKLMILVDFLKKNNIEIYIYVNKGVSSNALKACFELKRNGCKLIGEEIGLPINQFDNKNDKGLTPNYKLNIILPTNYVYLDNSSNKIANISAKKELYCLPKDTFVERFIEIDEYLPYKEDDFLQDTDPILFFAKNLSKNHRL
ncbi:MAG: hypothetical protein IJ572_05020 [Bacilli bacterium]|nr:hypothetical protein [Bacilli bacterium]